MSEQRFKVRRKADGKFLVRPNACPPFNDTGRAYTNCGAARCAIRHFIRYSRSQSTSVDFELVTLEVREIKAEAV